MTQDEEDLLKRTYFKRGVGWVNVSMEQIAWRRNTLVDKCGANLDDFHEQYPSTDMEAFLASGSPVFSPEKLIERELFTRPCVWSGDLFDKNFSPKEVPDDPGSLSEISVKQPGGPARKHVEWPQTPTFEPTEGHESDADSIMKAFGGEIEDTHERLSDSDRDPEWS